jgi:hypothetical protein
MKKRYVMTLIFDETTEHFEFWSKEEYADGDHNADLDAIMIDWLEENGYEIYEELPKDYIVDTYDNWAFIQGLLQQEQDRAMAEDNEWGCFPY